MPITFPAGRRVRRRGQPLRGVDLILLALDSEQGKGRAGCNNAVLAVELEGPVGVPRLEAAVARFVEHCPWPSARLRRPFPWGRLQWAIRGEVTPPPVERRTVDRLEPADVLRLVEVEMDERIDPWHEAPVRLRVVESPGSATRVLLFTWSRPFMDPHGAEAFLAHLDHLDRHPGPRPWGDEPPAFEPPPHTVPFKERGRLGLRSRAFMHSIGDEPPLSLGRGALHTGRARILRRTRPVSTALPERPYRDATFRFAAAGKAMAELFRRRGLPDTPFFIPFSADMRKKGDTGPVVSNYLTLHFLRFRPSETADAVALAAHLRRDLAAALKDQMLESHFFGMDFLQYRMIRSILKEMSWAKGKDPFSFNCTDTGEFAPALRSFLGAGVKNALHTPSPLPRPGVGIFFTRCGEVENAAVTWMEGVVSTDEAERVLQVVTRTLAWDGR